MNFNSRDQGDPQRRIPPRTLRRFPSWQEITSHARYDATSIFS